MRSFCCGLLSLVFSSLLSTSAALAVGGEGADNSLPSSTLELSYDLYAGGISLGKAGMTARFQGNDYKANSTLETKGIVNAFWQSKIEAASNGVLTNDRVQPALYDSYSQNRKAERRQVTLAFGPEGPKSMYSNPAYPETRYAVPESAQKKTLDPLSAVVFLTSALSSSDAKPCDAVAPIFDGRRRYDVGLSYVKKTTVKMDNGLYSGPAMVCQVHYNQIAGYQQTLVEQGKKLPPIYAWVADITSKVDPSRHFKVPLRVWAETEYGIIVALAGQLKLDGKALN
jgi:uncharacterized protein DUF3108